MGCAAEQTIAPPRAEPTPATAALAMPVLQRSISPAAETFDEVMTSLGDLQSQLLQRDQLTAASGLSGSAVATVQPSVRPPAAEAPPPPSAERPAGHERMAAAPAANTPCRDNVRGGGGLRRSVFAVEYEQAHPIGAHRQGRRSSELLQRDGEQTSAVDSPASVRADRNAAFAGGEDVPTLGRPWPKPDSYALQQKQRAQQQPELACRRSSTSLANARSLALRHEASRSSISSFASVAQADARPLASGCASALAATSSQYAAAFGTPASQRQWEQHNAHSSVRSIVGQGAGTERRQPISSAHSECGMGDSIPEQAESVRARTTVPVSASEPAVHSSSPEVAARALRGFAGGIGGMVSPISPGGPPEASPTPEPPIAVHCLVAAHANREIVADRAAATAAATIVARHEGSACSSIGSQADAHATLQPTPLSAAPTRAHQLSEQLYSSESDLLGSPQSPQAQPERPSIARRSPVQGAVLPQPAATSSDAVPVISHERDDVSAGAAHRDELQLRAGGGALLGPIEDSPALITFESDDETYHAESTARLPAPHALHADGHADQGAGAAVAAWVASAAHATSHRAAVESSASGSVMDSAGACNVSFAPAAGLLDASSAAQMANSCHARNPGTGGRHRDSDDGASNLEPGEMSCENHCVSGNVRASRADAWAARGPRGDCDPPKQRARKGGAAMLGLLAAMPLEELLDNAASPVR